MNCRLYGPGCNSQRLHHFKHMNNTTTQGRKFTINYTDSDHAKAILAQLIDHYMREKHADVIEQMKQYIADHFEQRSNTD